MDVTIIGSSVISLLSALVLTHAQYKVTIIASDLPGDQNQDWASPWYAYLTRTRRFIRKQVHSIEEAKHIVKRDMPVHASGLGAAQLAGDKDVLPIRGQTLYLETDFDELATFQGSHQGLNKRHCCISAREERRLPY